MFSSASSAISRRRRAQPWLGTLVDITLEVPSGIDANQAFALAFNRVALIHRLMSFQEGDSDIARINGVLPGRATVVSEHTLTVLGAARELFFASDGLFDCSRARPGRGREDPRQDGPGFDLVPSRHEVVRTDERVLDVSGLAKGYAVDEAIRLLKATEVTGALVDAGGDMRHFGIHAATIHLRDPADARRVVASIPLQNRALASSSTTGFSLGGEAANAAILDPRLGSPLAPDQGVGVLAEDCMSADALTKVALVSGHCHHPIFAQLGAMAFFVHSQFVTDAS